MCSAYANQSHFHMKGFAQQLVLAPRLKVSQKQHILFLLLLDTTLVCF